MVEMDVGIIAASLVVMRPCFQFLYNVATGRSNADLLQSTTRTGGGYSGSKLSSFGGGGTMSSALRRERKMSKAVDIEMESRLVEEESRGGSVADGGSGNGYVRDVGDVRDSFVGVAVEYEAWEAGQKGRMR